MKTDQLLKHPDRYLRKLIFQLYSISFLSQIIRFILSPWYEFRHFEDIYTYIEHIHGRFLFREPSILHFSEPVFFGSADHMEGLFSVTGPDKYAVLLDSANIIGGSGLVILQNRKVLYDLKFNDKKNRYLYTDQAIRYYNKDYCITLVVKKPDKAGNTLKEGIFMGGNYSGNYYHLLFEILVKFKKIDDLKIEATVPLLVDRASIEIPQFAEIFSILNKDSRKILIVEQGERYFVKSLYYISSPNVIPPNFRKGIEIKADDVLFDLESIEFLRASLLPFKSESEFPRKIFISRSNASGRRQFNEDEVYEELQKYGFRKVFPENLSITDQIAMFNNADYIASGSGAALTNLIFCNELCKVIVFVKNKLAFSGFSTITKHLGIKMIYLANETSCVSKIVDLHGSFNINLLLLREILKEVFK